MATNDGGPAFPVDFEPRLEGKSAGLSMRDYFAAAAMPVLLAQAESSIRQGLSFANQALLPKHIAIASYQMADVMLAVRDSGKESDTQAGDNFLCRICANSFPDNTTLRIHHQHFHGRTDSATEPKG